MTYRISFAILYLLTVIPTDSIWACSFCALDPGPSLLKELDAAGDAAFAELVQAGDPKAKRPVTEYRVTTVLRGGEGVQEGDVIHVPFYIQAPTGAVHLFFRDRKINRWRNPRGASTAAQEFLSLAAHLPVIDDESSSEDRVQRLAFMLPYLVSSDSEIARCAYGEFAAAPDAAVRELSPILNHRELMAWLNLETLSAKNRRLVFTLLGIAGHKEALPAIEDALEDRLASEKTADLDAILAAYLALTGPTGLREIEDRVLKRENVPLELQRSAANALRYHVDNGTVLKRQEVIASCRLLLGDPKTADLVIGDLARWEDWDSLDAILNLNAQADQNSWLKQPICDYLLACPLPAARSAVATENR